MFLSPSKLLNHTLHLSILLPYILTHTSYTHHTYSPLESHHCAIFSGGGRLEVSVYGDTSDGMGALSETDKGDTYKFVGVFAWHFSREVLVALSFG